MSRIKNKFVRISIKAAICALLLFMFTMNLFYINTTIYRFPKKEKFSGEFIFNPYRNLPDSSYKANFHAHSVAWSKVTNGHNSEKEMFDAYTKRGYDIAGISNYHKISDYGKKHTDLFVPVYEHGYNIFKSHCLGIDVDKVSYFDYPLFQSTSHKQKVINNIRANNGIVAMAHPKFGGGKTFEDMELLVNYNFMEVLNHYRISDEYWDKALSAGRLVWVMGNDDTHDLVKEPSFKIWNIIHSEYRNKDSILNEMKRGKNYAVLSKNGKCDNALLGVELVSPSEFFVKLENTADSIQFIGQDGKIVHTAFNASSVSYKFSNADTYVRVVTFNENSSLYLNPLFKYNGKEIPYVGNKTAETQHLATWMVRLLFIIIAISLLLLMRRVIRA